MADRSRARARRAEAGEHQSIAVIGLGRFGSALAGTLAELEHDVLGVDEDPRQVAAMRDVLSHVVEADSTDPVALEQLGLGDFDRAVVAIGTDVEASVLTTSALVDLGIGDIWAKAMSDRHARILERVGAHHIVFPEVQMGRRIAHQVAGRMLDFLPLDAGFALVEVVAPPSLHGRTLGESAVRARYDITVVCVKPAGGQFTYATADTVLNEGDVIVVAGEADSATRFAGLR